jgi:hypothetical protein
MCVHSTAERLLQPGRKEHGGLGDEGLYVDSVVWSARLEWFSPDSGGCFAVLGSTFCMSIKNHEL